MQLSKHFPDNVVCKCVTLHPSNTVPTGIHRHAYIATVFVWKKTQSTIFRFIVNKMPRQERTGFEIFDVRYKPQQNVLLVVWCFSVCLSVCLEVCLIFWESSARVRNWYWCGPSQSITLTELDIVCFSSDQQALGSTTARLLLQRLPVCGHFWRKNKPPSQYPSQWLLPRVRVRVRFKFGTSNILNFTPVILHWRGFYVCYRG